MQITRFHEAGLLSPSAGNPRNSEGAFLKLDDGRIAFAYSRYHGSSAGDDAACDICAVFSSDGGESFDTENYVTLVRASEYGEENVMSVSLMRMQNGDVGLFYLLKLADHSSEYILRRYDGSLREKKREVNCLADGFPAYYVVNNDRVVRLSSGRIVIPAALHANSNGRIDFRAETVFFASDDDGESWKLLRAKLTLDDPYTNTGLQEPGLVELANRTLYAYMRTDRMYQYESLSPDSEHFLGARPSRFTSPASPMLIKRSTCNGKFYAVWNPIPEYPTRPKSQVWTGGRNPLVIAESEDGLNFSVPIILEDDPTRGFCYPAMHFLGEKSLLLAYCSGGTEERGCLNRVTIRKVEFE